MKSSNDLTGLELSQLIERLAPIPEPAPVSLWPQTVGWLWLGLLLLAVGATWAVQRWQHYRNSAYRRAALAELVAAQDDPVIIANILRRTAIAAYGRRQVASLYGQQWLTFLDSSFPGTGFSQGPGQTLAIAPYTRQAATGELSNLASSWIKHHRPRDNSESQGDHRA